MEWSRYISAELWKIIIIATIATTCQRWEEVLFKPTLSHLFSMITSEVSILIPVLQTKRHKSERINNLSRVMLY